MAATIKDIARKLNISTSTVSYALNGGPRTVPEDVRLKVLETAKELQYRPNRLARSLITRRSHTIGVVPTEAGVNLAYTPYFQGCVNGILNEAEILAQDVLVYTRYDTNNPESLADSLLDGRVDGAIFLAPVRGSGIFDVLRQDDIPFVVLSSEHPNAPSFMVDNRGGATTAVRHLFELGHRRIAHVTGRMNLDDAIQRQQGYRDTVKELGLEPGLELEGDFTMDGGYDAGIRLFDMKPRPTAVFCGNDESAAGVMRAAWEHGIRIPEDLSVVGFDDAPLSIYTRPTLTTVGQPWEDMSKTALRALLGMVNGVPASGGLFSTRLVVRSSTTRPLEDTLS